MKVAFGYARKSPDDKNKTESSITNQIKMIESTAKEKMWDLKEIYIDNNISGGDRSRKEFSKLLKASIKYRDDHPDDEVYIIVKEQDRFARDSAFFSDTLRDLDIRLIRVFSIIKNNFLSYEDLGDVVTSVVDAHYIIAQRKKSKLLFEQMKAQGLAPIKPPFGYISKNSKWKPEKKKSWIVKEVCKSFASGENFNDIIKRLKISKNQYYRIIQNAKNGLYSGYVYYINKVKDSQKVVVREEEVKYKGSHDPIIDDQLLNKVIDHGKH